MNQSPICLACGSVIPKQATWAYRYYATRKFCNRVCEAGVRPDIEFDYIQTDSDCWEWQGRIDRNGYGKAYDPLQPAGRRVDWAHRISYRRHVGEIPDKHELDHLCENTICINPDHLEAVTRAEHAARTYRRLGSDKRHADAARLRVAGLTYGEIAEALELAGSASAFSAVTAAIHKGLVDPEALPTQRRLDDADREDIYALYVLGVPQLEIAAWYQVDGSQVSRICTRLKGLAS